MSSNSLELLDEGRVFELVHHPSRVERRPQSCSSASSNTQEGQKSSSKRAVSAVSRSLEVLPPEASSSPANVTCRWNLPPPPHPPASAASNSSSKDEETDYPLEGIEGDKAAVLTTMSLAPDGEPDGGEEGSEVEGERRGSPVVDKLMAEIQEMHLVVQALLKGSRRAGEEGEEEEEEERGGRKQQDSDRVVSLTYPSTISQERSSTTPGLEGSVTHSKVSSSTPQGQADADQELGEGRQKEWELLFGEEGEMADKLRKAVTKMKKLDDKLTSVTKKERELKLQRKHLEQQLAMLEAGTMDMVPLELEYKGEGLGAGQETDSDGSPSPPIPPVFATEIHPLSPIHTQLGGSGRVMGEGAGQVLEGRPPQPWSEVAAGEEKPSGQHGPEVQEGRRKKSRTKGEQPRQNFIQRNIELAADAGSGIAMTEEEKERLESLLLDSDGEEEEREGKTHHKQDADSRTALVSYTGFGVDVESTQRLRDIESRLTMYGGSEAERIGRTMSVLDSSLCQSGLSEPSESGSVYGETAPSHGTAGRGDLMVERVRSERDDQLRMREIDAQLHLLQQYKKNEGELEEEEEEESSSRLAADQLQALLAQCRNELATSQSGTLILDDAT